MLKSGSWKIRLAAAVCLALGFGLVVYIYKDRQKYGETAGEEGASMTKPHPRVPGDSGRKEGRLKNPREQFEAARKRGLTEEEVRGIVVEFFTLEISTKWSEETTVEEYAKLGDKAREWYRETLASGFGLTRNQEVEVAGKIREFRKTDLKDFKEELASFRTFIERWEAVDAEARPTVYSLDLESGPSIQEGFGLWRDYYLLRNLCELDEGQKEMIGCIGEKGKWTWVDGTERTLDYGTTESYGDLSDPFADGDSILYEAGKIFPLSMGQVDRLGPFHDEAVSPHTPKVINGEYLEQAKFLTAPQLKTLLLFDPEMGGRLIKELAE